VAGLIRRLLCRLSLLPLWWFHRVEVIETYDRHTRKLQCTLCGAYFAMSDRQEAVLPWDDDYERIICDLYEIPRSKL
jgi:hypothetical protein